ncbi:MAG: Nif3-like dinuclear metal center hexameric protein [Planctomycetota bacterium]
MLTIQQVTQFLEQFAPTRLAEDWDNVGLLVGDRQGQAKAVMTCLTVTPETVEEAIEQNADLIVSHHPLPFRPLKRITTDQVPSKLLWDLVRAEISVYSPHTGFDSACQGINQSLGHRLGLNNLKPILPIPDDPQQLGSGRLGVTSETTELAGFVATIKHQFDLPTLQVVGTDQQTVHRVAIACGSGGSFLTAAIESGCDTFVTGETTFHTALEAKANGLALVLLGHYQSERFAVEMLAEELSTAFSNSQLKVWASQQETDPLRFV